MDLPRNSLYYVHVIESRAKATLILLESRAKATLILLRARNRIASKGHTNSIRIASKGHNEGNAAAMFKLGILHKNGGAGLVTDRTQARAWYERAAELSHVKGMSCFGESLLKGTGGPSNPVLELVFITRAAEAGSDMAAYILGKAFVTGTHVACRRIRRRPSTTSARSLRVSANSST